MTAATEHLTPKLLTVREIAEYLGVSRMTVYRMLHDGDIPSVRLRRSFRVSEDDFAQYLRNAGLGTQKSA